MPEAHRLARRRDDPGCLRAREPGVQMLRGRPRRALQRVDRRARHRRGEEQHLPGRRRQPLQPARDQLADVLGNGKCVTRCGRPARSKRRRELERVERVAGRRAMNAQQRGPTERAAQPRLDQLMQRAGAQTGRLESARVARPAIGRGRTAPSRHHAARAESRRAAVRAACPRTRAPARRQSRATGRRRPRRRQASARPARLSTDTAAIATARGPATTSPLPARRRATSSASRCGVGERREQIEARPSRADPSETSRKAATPTRPARTTGPGMRPPAPQRHPPATTPSCRSRHHPRARTRPGRRPASRGKRRRRAAPAPDRERRPSPPERRSGHDAPQSTRPYKAPTRSSSLRGRAYPPRRSRSLRLTESENRSGGAVRGDLRRRDRGRAARRRHSTGTRELPPLTDDARRALRIALDAA